MLPPKEIMSHSRGFMDVLHCFAYPEFVQQCSCLLKGLGLPATGLGFSMIGLFHSFSICSKILEHSNMFTILTLYIICAEQYLTS